MLVSVIVPVFNAENYLVRSIESVVNQSYEHIELILINDGSTDRSKLICDQYALADGRIRVISQKNRGPAAARNAGIRNAAGDFVFFLDADDYIEKDTLEILMSTYHQYRPELVMANFSKLSDIGEILKQSVSFHPDAEPFELRIKELSRAEVVDYVRHFLKHPSNHLISYCWARLYKTSIIKKHGVFANEAMHLFEDFVFNLEYLKHTHTIVFVNESLYTYAMHHSHPSVSMSIVNGDRLLHDMTVFKKTVGEFSEQIQKDTVCTIDIDREVGHALIHYVIIFFIRSCRLMTRHNKNMIYDEIVKIVNAPILRDSLRYYSPSKGNTRVLPFLMKIRLIALLMLFCKHKAYKRYGKPETV